MKHFLSIARILKKLLPLFCASFFPLEAWPGPAVQNIRACSSFHSCFAQDCFASFCPVVRGEPQCDMAKVRLPKSRSEPGFVTFKNASRPFFWNAKGRAKGTFLFVHGLSDSPYTFGPLAEELAARGYNSVAILLTGHGADNHLNHTADSITAEAWQSDLNEGLRYTVQKYRGSPLFLSGFSTGGAVVTLFLLQHKNLLPGPQQDKRIPLRGIVLYDPALGLSVAPQALIQNKDLLRRVVPPGSPEDASITVGNNPARIPFDTVNIAPALGQTIAKIDEKISELNIPTLGLFTSGSGNSADEGGATTILTWRARGKLQKIVPRQAPLVSPTTFIQQIHNQILNREELGACVPRIKREGHYVNTDFSSLVKLTVDFADSHLADHQQRANSAVVPGARR